MKNKCPICGKSHKVFSSAIKCASPINHAWTLFMIEGGMKNDLQYEDLNTGATKEYFEYVKKMVVVMEKYMENFSIKRK